MDLNSVLPLLISAYQSSQKSGNSSSASQQQAMQDFSALLRATMLQSMSSTPFQLGLIRFQHRQLQQRFGRRADALSSLLGGTGSSSSLSSLSSLLGSTGSSSDSSSLASLLGAAGSSSTGSSDLSSLLSNLVSSGELKKQPHGCRQPAVVDQHRRSLRP